MFHVNCGLCLQVLTIVFKDGGGFNLVYVCVCVCFGGGIDPGSFEA